MPDRSSTEAPRVEGAPAVRVPLAAEQLHVDTRRRRTGTVRVRTRVEERTALVDLPLHTERVEIRRRRTDRFVDRPPDVRRDGDTLIVPVVEEVVTTRLKVVEEIHITLRRSIERRPQRVQVRRERAVIERLAAHANRPKERSQ